MWRKKYPSGGYSLACHRVRNETFVEEGEPATFVDVETTTRRCRHLVHPRGVALPFQKNGFPDMIAEVGFC